MESISRMIAHVDMDAFYASIEELDNPDLKGRSVIVGGSRKRGVVASANYQARSHGVRSAMPIYKAAHLCPDAVFCRVRMKRYLEVSKMVQKSLELFSPQIETVSIDEAYMDISGLTRLFGDFHSIGRKIKERVLSDTGLSCSVGIAPVKFLSKVASDMEKPDGLFVILPEDLPGFIRRLPVEKVPGVGQKVRGELNRMGIRFLGEISNLPENILAKKMGKFGSRLSELARGKDDTAVVCERQAKSTGRELTLDETTSDKKRLRLILLAFSDILAADLRKKKALARRVTIKVKESDFRQITRSVTLREPTRSSALIFSMACSLLERYVIRKEVRLIGLSAARLVHEMHVQPSLFEAEDSWERAGYTIDEIKKRFGSDAVARASLIERIKAF